MVFEGSTWSQILIKIHRIIKKMNPSFFDSLSLMRVFLLYRSSHYNETLESVVVRTSGRVSSGCGWGGESVGKRRWSLMPTF